MAKFNAQGIDGLELSLQEFSEIPDDVVDDMLDAAGTVVVRAHKAAIQTEGLVDTHKLLDSITAFHKVGKDRIRKVVVYPAGKHGDRHRKKVTKKYKRSKHGRTYTVGGDTVDVTNSEVGFIYEYGAPRRGIRAREWMRKANDKCAQEMTAAEAAVYDRWMESIGLGGG